MKIKDNNGDVREIEISSSDLHSMCDWVKSCSDLDCDTCPARKEKGYYTIEEALEWWKQYETV